MPSLLALASTLVIVQAPTLPSVTARPAQGYAVCKTESLPKEIQDLLKSEFAAWKIQEPDTLNPTARERWESEKPLQCPGTSTGQFEMDKVTSYGFLLVPRGQPDAGYKFLVFSPKGEMNAYETRLLDHSDSPGASNVFIRGAEISKFFSESSKRKFRVHARQGILFVDSGKNEYEVDIYFWVSNKYESQSVDY